MAEIPQPTVLPIFHFPPAIALALGALPCTFLCSEYQWTAQLWFTLTRFSEKGLPLTTASWARRTFAAATNFIASVIFWVFFTVEILSRVSFRPADTCSSGKNPEVKTYNSDQSNSFLQNQCLPQCSEAKSPAQEKKALKHFSISPLYWYTESDQNSGKQ